MAVIDWLRKRASYSCCNFLYVMVAAAYLKYRRCRLSCLPFVWHFFSLSHFVTHTHTHTCHEYACFLHIFLKIPPLFATSNFTLAMDASKGIDCYEPAGRSTAWGRRAAGCRTVPKDEVWKWLLHPWRNSLSPPYLLPRSLTSEDEPAIAPTWSSSLNSPRPERSCRRISLWCCASRWHRDSDRLGWYLVWCCSRAHRSMPGRLIQECTSMSVRLIFFFFSSQDNDHLPRTLKYRKERAKNRTANSHDFSENVRYFARSPIVRPSYLLSKKWKKSEEAVHKYMQTLASNQALPALDTSHATCCYWRRLLGKGPGVY